MPRQDVPYGGAICRLKERIAEIFDKLGEKLHTINGVPGDGDGNVKIVSGSSAVVISNDPTQNEIAVSLDTSQLPAASVSSVNGQTGAVALDAGDIPTVGGDVQADLQDLANDISGNTAAINAEVLARQGADSALQTNINNVSASLPSAAAAAVAADPTVAQLATDVPNKLDKITSGSSLKAYTHTGATQGEVSVVDGTTANSIGIRDANGRMQAADPASGATDKTLVTANWVSQTGNGAPNNLIHKTGNETYSGNLDVEGTLITPIEGQYLHFTGYYYQHLFDVDIPSGRFLIAGDFVLMTGQLALTLTIYSNNNVYGNLINLTNDTQYTIFVLKNSITGLFEVWMNNMPRSRISFYPKILRKGNYANLDENIQRITLVNSGSNTDPATDTTTYPDGKKLITTYNVIL